MMRMVVVMGEYRSRRQKNRTTATGMRQCIGGAVSRRDLRGSRAAYVPVAGLL